MKKQTKTVVAKGVVWLVDRPFNELPLLPPPAELDSKAILKQCIPAHKALAELKQAAQLIPNPAMLINTMPLLEAQASSEIDNIVTTTDRLFQFRGESANADPATKEALRYSHALFNGYQELTRRPLCTQTAESVCTIIKGVEMKVRRISGTALGRDSGEIVYTPPVGEDLLRSLLANWERFLHEQRDLDPLVRMAVGHYQFEAIHPFTDGNGRTGRVLNSLFLVQEGLLTLPILYLSRYILQNRSDYYRLLLNVTREQAWEEWVLYILKGIEVTAAWTAAKIATIRRLASHTVDHVRSRLPAIYSQELVNLIFERPYCRIQDVTGAQLAERRAASRYLKQLVEIGVLEEKPVGREKLFLHPKFLSLLIRDDNEFAEYA